MKSYFYSLLTKYISLYIRPEDSVVEIDPQHTLLLEMIQVRKKAVHLSQKSVISKTIEHIDSYDNLKIWKPDYLLLNGNLHYESDIQSLFEKLKNSSVRKTRLIVTYYNNLWRPLITIATHLGMRHKTPEQNWIAHEDIDTMLKLADFELIQRSHHILIPFKIPLVSKFFNRYIANLPFFRWLSMITIVVARPLIASYESTPPSVSIVIPVRNESGNIEKIVERIPTMGINDEIIFVEGGSKDTTWETIERVAMHFKDIKKIVYTKQAGKGKGDAVRKGFSIATNDILMILDADISVAPEELPKFYKAIIENKGELIIGSRLVYPMQPGAMRFLNILGNRFFATAFSFILGQRFKDTLCGTKVLTKESYQVITANRSFFGNFDPFGDFDLIFGASRSAMKIVEIPVPYYERIYGETNIKRWSQGFMLFEMLLFAARKIKFI